MKRFSVIMSVFIALAVAAPAFAVEFDATGTLRFQGVYNDKASSSKDDKDDSYRDMRLRVRTELKVTDKISLITRFDALDKVLSSNDSALEGGSDETNIDFDRAYMRIVSPIGLFMVGRQEGTTWGTPFADDEADTDRIKYVLPIPVGDNKLYLAAVAEKVTEADKGYELSNKDNDKYYLAATYVAENFRTGFLTAFYHFNTFQDPGQATVTADYYAAQDDLNDAIAYAEGSVHPATYAGTYAVAFPAAYAAAMGGLVPGIDPGDAAASAEYAATAAGTAAGAGANTAKDNAIEGAYNTFGAAAMPAMAKFAEYGKTAQGKVYLLSPYFTGKFGGLGISTELDYITGTVEYKDAPTDVDDKDVAAYSFMFETTYEAGPAGFQIGFATQSGDTDFDDDDVESMGYVSPGADWAKMFILSSSGSANDGATHGMNTSLGGGLGNHAGDGFGSVYTTLLSGYQMFYLGADYDLTETMNIEALMCISKADDAPDTFDDDQGYEVDVNFTWKLMDNLEYSGTAAYLAAGDYWKGANEAGDGEDTLSLYHKLELTF